METADASSASRRRTIEVVDDDPARPIRFAEIRTRMQDLLANLVMEIHHIGSTAVPGLSAKPKIDVDVVLRSTADIPDGIALLRAAGDYAFHGDKYQENIWACPHR